MTIPVSDFEYLTSQVNAVRCQAESYLARARTELTPGVGLELCETALNDILDVVGRDP